MGNGYVWRDRFFGDEMPSVDAEFDADHMTSVFLRHATFPAFNTAFSRTSLNKTSCFEVPKEYDWVAISPTTAMRRTDYQDVIDQVREADERAIEAGSSYFYTGLDEITRWLCLAVAAKAPEAAIGSAIVTIPAEVLSLKEIPVREEPRSHRWPRAGERRAGRQAPSRAAKGRRRKEHGMPEKKAYERVQITMPESMTRLAGEDYAILRRDPVTGKEEKEVRKAEWNTFLLPPRLVIDDARLGYGTVINRYATAEDDGTVRFPFISDKPIQVQVQKRDEGGDFVRDEQGHRVMETVEVDPAKLKDALDQNVYITMPKGFVRRNIPYTDAEGNSRTFNSVTCASGTTIGDLDLSNAQFSPFCVSRGYRTEQVDVIPLPKGRPVRLNLAEVDEEGHTVHRKDNYVEVDPEELASAIAEQRAEYVARRRAETAAKEEPPIAPETRGQSATRAPRTHTTQARR